MSDPIVGKVIEQGTKSFGAVFDKLLGPTAEFMGQELVDWYTRRKNVKKVLDRAAARVDLDELGCVSPRMVSTIFDHAQWTENEFLSEYLSGVLASSRTLDGTDDSGIPWASLIGRLSSDQLSIHWLLYSEFQRLMRVEDSGEFWTALQKQIAITDTDLFDSLGWAVAQQTGPRLIDAMFGLQREGILADLSFGNGAYLEDEVSWTKGHNFEKNLGYLTFKLTSQGVGLLLYGIGCGGTWVADLASAEVNVALDETEALPESANWFYISR